MTAELLATVLGASLAGSLHCAGMCGGFVAFYSGGDRFLRHAAYNGGRLASYLVVGALAGLLGAAVDLAGTLAGLQRVAALAAGTLMVVWGGLGLLRALQVRLPEMPLPRILRRVGPAAYRATHERPPLVRAGLLGLFSALLPCGWLYAFAVLAAGTASPWLGMLVLGAFWIGTVPVLAGLGLTLDRLGARARRRMPILTASVLLLLGLLWLAGRVGLPGPTAAHCAPSAAESRAE